MRHFVLNLEMLEYMLAVNVADAIICEHPQGQQWNFLFDSHFDPAYSWIPNTARTTEQLEDYSRWQREAKPKRIGLRYVPDGRLDPFDALEGFCAWCAT